MIVNRAFPCEGIFKVTLCNFVCSFLALLSVGKTNGVHKMVLMRFVLLLASVNNRIKSHRFLPSDIRRFSLNLESSLREVQRVRHGLGDARCCHWDDVGGDEGIRVVVGPHRSHLTPRQRHVVLGFLQIATEGFIIKRAQKRISLKIKS